MRRIQENEPSRVVEDVRMRSASCRSGSYHAPAENDCSLIEAYSTQGISYFQEFQNHIQPMDHIHHRLNFINGLANSSAAPKMRIKNMYVNTELTVNTGTSF